MFSWQRIGKGIESRQKKKKKKKKKKKVRVKLRRVMTVWHGAMGPIFGLRQGRAV